MTLNQLIKVSVLIIHKKMEDFCVSLVSLEMILSLRWWWRPKIERKETEHVTETHQVTQT